MYRHAFRVLAQRAPVATAAAATALVVAPPSRCDWWSSKKPSAPAPAAAAAPPVVEPKTGVQFPAEQGGLKLAGCGVRVKYGFIKVYAVGVYVSPRVALDKRAASPLAALRTARRDGAVVELRLTMARDVPKKTFVDALAEQITPRAGAPQSDTFAAAITGGLRDPTPEGSTTTIRLDPDGTILCANQPVSRVHSYSAAARPRRLNRVAQDPHRHAIELASRRVAPRQFDVRTGTISVLDDTGLVTAHVVVPAVCDAFLDIYLGADGISPTTLEAVKAGLEKF